MRFVWLSVINIELGHNKKCIFATVRQTKPKIQYAYVSYLYFAKNTVCVIAQMTDKKISFGFSKLKKPAFLPGAVQKREEVQLIQCLEGQTIKIQG